jgi:hypothetical protein
VPKLLALGRRRTRIASLSRWQVTGIRQDAWANAHRIPVEEEKNEREAGFYIHPELFGAPPEKQIEWARHPEMIKRGHEQQRIKNQRQMEEQRGRVTTEAKP